MAKHPFTFIRDDDYCVVRVVAEQYMKENEGFGDYNMESQVTTRKKMMNLHGLLMALLKFCKTIWMVRVKLLC